MIVFFFNDTATTEIYTLSLHDALPISGKTSCALKKMVETFYGEGDTQILLLSYTNRAVDEICKAVASIAPEVDFIRVGSELACEETYREHRSEEHTSELQSRQYLVCRLLLEKKKIITSF